VGVSRSHALELENAALRDQVRRLEGTIASLEVAIAMQTAANAALTKAFEEQKVALDRTLASFEQLKSRLFRKKSEKLPPPEESGGGPPAPGPSREDTLEKRRARAATRRGIATERTPVSVPLAKRVCPHCVDVELRRVGAGRTVTLVDYEPGRFVQREYELETLACSRCDHIVSAEAPARPVEGGRYGPRFIAHVVVQKLLYATPHHRLEKMFADQGVPMSRSTMTDLLHRAATLLEPVFARLLALIATADVVQADETSIRVQHRDKLAFMWTFLSEDLVAYRFSPDRSGETPVAVLGESLGALVVDGYSGYNRVLQPRTRRRVGCWAHVRRKFFELRESVPETTELLELIAELYRIERGVREGGLAGGPAHLEARVERSGPVLARIFSWLELHRPLHPPRSAFGGAISYAIKNRDALTAFLGDPALPLDNNRSESALRWVALGRKNYLFVGNDDAGGRIAGLLSLVATCVRNEVNPLDYLADVLLRVHERGVSLDDLLPHRWKPPPLAEDPAAA
jgi:transposase